MPARGQKKPKPILGDHTDPRGMAHLICGFIEYLRVRNYSERTVDQRRKCLNWFTEWCEERGITRPSEITRPVLERYQRFLYHYRKDDGTPLTFGSQFTRLVSVRMFFKWLVRNNHLLYNPASELELPRLEQRLPQAVLTAKEADAVLNQPNTNHALGIRDRAILETFYSTGMRRFELAGLRLTDLDAERGTILIRQGKGKKDRMIPIGARAVAWIEKYLREVRPQLAVEPDDGTLFLTQDGTSFVLARLSHIVKGCLDRAGIGKGGGCHLFRHTCATLMLEGGADIRFIQQMLGHVSLETTQIYTQVSIRQLKAIHTATHPARLHRTAAAASEATNDDAHTEDAREDLLAMLAVEAAEEDDAPAAAVTPP
jgi:integrase/recombinase XerD